MLQGRARLGVDHEEGRPLELVLATHYFARHLVLIVQTLFVHSGDDQRLGHALERSQELMAVVGANGHVRGQPQRHVEVNVGQGIGDLGCVVAIFVAVAPPLIVVRVADEGGIGARAEVDVVLSQGDLLGAVPPGDDDPRGRLSHSLLDHGGGNMHQRPC